MPAGRPRKTKEVLELSGAVTYNKKRYESYGSSKSMAFPRDTHISCPKRFLKKTQQAWNTIIPAKIMEQVLCEEDLPHVEAMFSFYDEYVRIDNKLQAYLKDDDWDFNPDVLKIVRTLMKLKSDAFSHFSEIALRFGVTPVERTKLQMPEESVKDALDEILG